MATIAYNDVCREKQVNSSQNLLLSLLCVGGVADAFSSFMPYESV
jgi:hypothetical protein